MRRVATPDVGGGDFVYTFLAFAPEISLPALLRAVDVWAMLYGARRGASASFVWLVDESANGPRIFLVCS